MQSFFIIIIRIMKNKKKLSEFLFWLPQIIFVVFEYAFIITLFILMIKNLYTDDYNDPYFFKLDSFENNYGCGRCGMLYSLGVLAIKFILRVKNLFI